MKNGISNHGDQDDANINRLADYITKIIIPANPNGFTIDPVTLQMPSFPRSVYIVSRKDCERRFYRTPRLKEVSDWLWQNSELLSRPGHYIGGWQDGGHFFLDVSIAIKGSAEALNTAYANQQIAFFYPFTGRSYYLPDAA